MLGIVANLEKMRLLHRTPHQTHGRIMQSELTEKGTDVLASARKAIDNVEKSMAVGFTAKEIATTTVHASTVCPEYAFRI